MPSVKVPQDYRCPITQQMMVDPVLTSDGQTYEREAIEEWLTSHNTSPATGQRLANKNLTPNIRLKSIISDFLQQNPQLYQEGEVYLKKGALKALYEALVHERSQDFSKILAQSDYSILSQVTETGYTLFHLVCEYGSVSIFREFMQTYNSEYKLFAALTRPQSWNPKVLDSELLEAAKSGTTDSMQLMLTLGANINSRNQNGYTALFLAIKENQMESVKLLYNNGADINAPITLAQDYYSSSITPDSYTPLQFAMQINNVAGLNTLISLGANIEQPNTKGLTPLHKAVDSNNQAMVWLLLNAKASIDTKTAQGNTALLLAVRKGLPQIARLLLENGADPNAVNLDGRRVIHEAVKSEQVQLDTISWLLHYNVDCSVRDSNGYTADELVYQSRNNIKEILVKKIISQREGVVLSTDPTQRALTESVKQLQLQLAEQLKRIDLLWQQTQYLTLRDEESQKQIALLQANAAKISTSTTLPLFKQTLLSTASTINKQPTSVTSSAQLK